MADIVITEFMDEAAIARIAKGRDCLVDTTLWRDATRLKAAVAECRGLIVRNRTQVTEDVLAAAPKLTCVGRVGVGLDNIDVAACRARGIAVYPATGANAVSVAEYVIGSMLVLVRGTFMATPDMVAGKFPREALAKGREVMGRTLGIIGLGMIGQTVAQRLQPFGMHIIAYDPALPAGHEGWRLAEPRGLDDLIAEADVISLHVPLTAETRGLISGPQLAAMKAGAVVINTSRGGVVDERALADALRSGRIGGAALDVFEEEPILPETAELFQGLTNVILSPHVSGVTEDSNVRASNMIVDRVIAHLGPEA